MRAPHPFDVAESFIELSRGGMTGGSLAVGFGRALETLGFRHWALCSHIDPRHRPQHAILLHNYPQAWAQHYSEAGLYEIDPVLQRAGRDPLPFFWDAAFEGEAVTAAQRKLLEDAAGFGVAHGYTVPIHLSWLPGALRASCSVVPDGAVDRRSYSVVQAIATCLYTALSCPRPLGQVESSVGLSRREHQCLALAAQGKDDWAIGELLHLSHETVHWYLKRLMRRLGMSTRIQAVMWALENGQLSFGEVLPPPPDKGDSPGSTLPPCCASARMRRTGQ